MSSHTASQDKKSPSSVLVMGATRGTGRLVVEELLARGTKIRVAARDTQKARELFGETVEIVHADLLRELPAGLFDDVRDVIYTAAVPPRPAGAALVRATEVEGLRSFVTAAQRSGFRGRFVYMTTMGVTKPNWMMAVLGVVKRGIISARRDAEALLSQSGFDLTIVRAGTLTNGPAGKNPVLVVAGDAEPRLSRMVSRADVARVLVESLVHRAREVSVYESRSATTPVKEQLRALAA